MAEGRKLAFGPSGISFGHQPHRLAMPGHPQLRPGLGFEPLALVEGGLAVGRR